MAIKITVLKIDLNKEFVDEYAADKEGFAPCKVFEVGQEFILPKHNKPDDFCSWAWADIQRDVVAMNTGASFPWIGPKGVSIACCTDGLRPVTFKIEKIELSNNIDSDDTTSKPYKILSDEEVAAFLRKGVKEVEQDTARRIAEAIASNPDKEPFDFNKFSKLYWRQSVVGGNPSPNSSSRAQEEYRQRYYLDHSEVQTISDFAKALEELDAQSGN